MPRCLVLMSMAVPARWKRIMRMRMVAVVVAVGVLVFRLVMHVFVRMAFCQMKHDARGHQHRTGEHPGTAAAFTERKREERTDEWSEREHRAGARRAEGTLGQQVEAKTEAIAGCADCQQGQRSTVILRRRGQRSDRSPSLRRSISSPAPARYRRRGSARTGTPLLSPPGA